MEWQALIADGYDRVLETLERALNGLTPMDLNQQPEPDSNSIGWLAWHLARIQDSQIADLAGKEQTWISDEWYHIFNRPAHPQDNGFGHTSDEVNAFQSPEVTILLDYHRAVLEETKQYLSTLSAADLDRELNEPWFQPLPTVGVRLISIMTDCLLHAGQVAYARGLLKGKGWQSF